MRILRILGIILGGIVGLALIAVLVIFGLSASKLGQQHAIDVETVTVPTGAEAIAQGQYLYTARACVDCHGPNAEGTAFIEDPALGTIHAPNLTPAGVGATYTDQDWVGAIRHGIRPDGTSLLIMPSTEYYYLDDADVGNLIAYFKSLPATGTPAAPRSLGPIGTMLVATDQLPLVVNTIDHERARPAAVPHEATPEYGRYLATLCIGCHGMDLQGGAVPGEEPPINSPSITSTGSVGDWTQEEFITAFRTGQRPDGSMISEVMPWPSLGQSNDTDLTALYLYLHDVESHELP